jgi:hypothetical protein
VTFLFFITKIPRDAQTITNDNLQQVHHSALMPTYFENEKKPKNIKGVEVPLVFVH